MLEGAMSGYLLLNCEPWADASQAAALETLAKSRAIVAVTPYANAAMSASRRCCCRPAALPKPPAPM